jgi:formylglycine-generating enzyme
MDEPPARQSLAAAGTADTLMPMSLLRLLPILAIASLLAGCERGDAAQANPAAVGEIEMILIPGGTFTMGTAEGYPFEGPPHEVTLKPFWIDKHEVTVGQFAKFVEATGYITEAERFGWSGVFSEKTGHWEAVTGATWRKPMGPAAPAARADEPVTQISYNDAQAYAKWAGKRLPTEAEFEFAARGGLEGKTYAWGDELYPDSKHLANIWQGHFPTENRHEDGYGAAAPVMSFSPNGYGLYDMAGNACEWTADWFSEATYAHGPYPRVNPTGPPNGEERVIRGGSFLCSDNYCTGYRVAARMKSAPDSGLNNTGFRCARDAE